MLRSLMLSSLLVVGLAAPAFAQSAASLVGTYAYDGTETDGKKYSDPGTLVITTEKSGALGLKWDDGTYLGVGQVVGDTLAVASVADGKNTIMLMKINPDGSLEGSWWRRTDPGSKGSEVWKKK